MVTFEGVSDAVASEMIDSRDRTFLFVEPSIVTKGLHARDVSATDIKVYEVPQAVFGAGYKIDVTVTALVSTQINLWFHYYDGTAWRVPIVNRDGTVSVTSGYNPGQLAEGSTWRTTITSSSPDISRGFISPMIIAPGGVKQAVVSVSYSYAPGGSVEGQAAVDPILPSKSFGFTAAHSVAADQDFVNTGFAIANPNDAPAHVTVTFRNMSGRVMVSHPLTIIGFGQVAMFVTDLAPELQTGWPGGYVEVNSDQDIGVVNLKYTVGSSEKVIFSTGITFSN